MSKEEGGRNSSLSEKPVRPRPRRLVEWINPTGAKSFDGDANQCTVSSHRRRLRRQSWPGVICDATYRGWA